MMIDFRASLRARDSLPPSQTGPPSQLGRISQLIWIARRLTGSSFGFLKGLKGVREFFQRCIFLPIGTGGECGGR